ncbi:MAG: hypothetical protein ACRD4B_06955, partial [Acidobacteriota bacterium]
MNPEDRTTLYLDVDDDITAIIGKVGQAAKDQVALVVPKRSNVLQSAVNLKLIKKSSKESGKTPVLITDDAAVMRMAGGLGLMTAPNLKAESAVPKLDEPTSGVVPSDTIEGQTVGEPAAAKSGAEAAKAVADTDTAKPSDAAKAVKPAEAAKAKKAKIPDFNRFKKRILLIAGGVVLAVVAILALFFWLPKATVIVEGATQGLNSQFAFSVDTDANQPNYSTAVLPGQIEQANKTLTANFTPTGKKDLGTKATGTISITQCVDSTSSSYSAGTSFSANGKAFTANQGFSVSGATFSGGSCSDAGSG